ncbi:FxSxx-COOH system tetratricopeptide repeat protein [Paractinoplanes durhamensis]|uniref:FxSxx-COOH system tetratricopeptide repeat protein n=2 Tax=Paractinoplanes durhamensis TaxID=113563 RepID=UPI00362CE6C9
MTRVDFLISYAGPDRPWAEWAAQQLERNKFTVELDVWDWATGDNFVLRMSDALARCDRVLALLSKDYFDRERFTTDEWTVVLAERPDKRGRRLIPLRVAEVEPPSILRAVLYRDLFGVPELEARQRLLAAVTGPSRPAGDVPFPGSAVNNAPTPPTGGARVPGSLPAVWNVRRRNPAFTGREAELAGLRQRLCSGDRALVQALHGIGGVGKTELVVEYAHLFANEYDLVWWIDAERPELIGEQLAALAVAADWLTPGASATPAATESVMRRFHGMPGWLLIYDNAPTADAVGALIPDGTGHVVITSRSRQTSKVAAAPIEVDVLTRPASVQLVLDVRPELSATDVDRLAAAVEDLPLALTQAAGLLAETGMTVDEYLQELTVDPAAVLSEGPTGHYPGPLAAAVAAAMRHLAGQDEAAAQLLRLIAVLAPEAVPLRWLIGTPEGTLPRPLATVASRTLALRRTLGRIAALGLARVDSDVIQMHRLTQAIVARTTSSAETESSDRLLVEASPGYTGEPALWPKWADLLPHLLVRMPVTASSALRDLAASALYYLVLRGDYRTAKQWGHLWHEQLRQQLGPDDLAVLEIAAQLANAHALLGEYQEARRLNEDTLTRRRRILGDDDPVTLRSADSLGSNLSLLGDHEQARRRQEDALARSRRVLGDDDAETLSSANNLARSLYELGEYEQAHSLYEDTLTRRRRVLGICQDR